jgi:hypothetical protein
MPGVPHLLIDEDGQPLAEATFGVEAKQWTPGETVILGALDRYRVVERLDPEPGHVTVTLVVERV